MVRLPRLNEACADRRAVLRIRGSASGEAEFSRACCSHELGQSGQIKYVQSANYWSATTNADNPTNAWNVNFNNGNVNNDNKTNNNHAWRARGEHACGCVLRGETGEKSGKGEKRARRKTRDA